MLLCHSFKPFHHCEHNAHRDDADSEEHGPCYPDGSLVVDQRADPEHEVADGGGSEPQTLTETLHVLGCYFGYEGESERRDEQLGYSHEEIVQDEYPGT